MQRKAKVPPCGERSTVTVCAINAFRSDGLVDLLIRKQNLAA